MVLSRYLTTPSMIRRAQSVQTHSNYYSKVSVKIIFFFNFLFSTLFMLFVFCASIRYSASTIVIYDFPAFYFSFWPYVICILCCVLLIFTWLSIDTEYLFRDILPYYYYPLLIISHRLLNFFKACGNRTANILNWLQVKRIDRKSVV